LISKKSSSGAARRKHHRRDADDDSDADADENGFKSVKKIRIDAVDTARGERRTDKQRQATSKKKTKTSMPRARSISYYADENQRLKEELRRMTVRRADLLELWQQLETALQTLDRQTKEIRGLKEDIKTYRNMAARRGERYSEIRRVLHKVTGGEGLAACHLWRVRQLNRISNAWPLGYGQRLRSVLEEWKRENGIRPPSPPPV
jgi:hypothetical protein